jgi:predicted RNA-binding protein associated with RNAse of E/G family
MLFRKNDRFVEMYYSDRWYNIFEIHDREDDHLKGWYCNIGYPAEIEKQHVSYRDLALDLLVFPDGRQLVLDEDEFESLGLEPEVSQQAWHALEELQDQFKKQLKADITG